MTSLPTWITDPALTDAWSKIQDRFEKAGLVAVGRVEVETDTRDKRHALGALMGRSVTQRAMRVDLGDLDQRLRDRSGVGGLQEVLTAIHGEAPKDRPAARATRRAARQMPLDRAAELVQPPWADTWIDGLRRTGLLTGREDSLRIVEDAAKILNELVVPSVRPQSRVELAARMLGNAHALDADRVLHRVVVRGLAAAAGVGVPEATPAVLGLWSRFGVEPDLLSRTCLVLGLRAPGAAGERLGLAAESGDPVHITEWDLRRLGAFDVGNRNVLVCENPRVLEAIAETGDSGHVVVCTSGEPNLVVTEILGRLHEEGEHLRYHGDFDWPGIGIANRVRELFGAQPWLMAADDYVGAVRQENLALGPHIIEPTWDPELGAAMRLHGRAVHEESMLAQILGHLATWT